MNYVNEVGFEEIIERGAHVASQLPSDIIYAGFSLGVLAAQKLAQRDSPVIKLSIKGFIKVMRE